jgi:hypothetical protein
VRRFGLCQQLVAQPHQMLRLAEQAHLVAHTQAVEIVRSTKASYQLAASATALAPHRVASAHGLLHHIEQPRVVECLAPLTELTLLSCVLSGIRRRFAQHGRRA